MGIKSFMDACLSSNSSSVISGCRASCVRKAKMIEFFSNKYNLYGLLFTCSLILSYVFWQISQDILQVLVLYSIVVLMNFTSYLYGMSKGLIHMYERSHIYKKLIDRAEQLQETDKDGK